jgi:hypothetical protein
VHFQWASYLLSATGRPSLAVHHQAHYQLVRIPLMVKGRSGDRERRVEPVEHSVLKILRNLVFGLGFAFHLNEVCAVLQRRKKYRSRSPESPVTMPKFQIYARSGQWSRRNSFLQLLLIFLRKSPYSFGTFIWDGADDGEPCFTSGF